MPEMYNIHIIAASCIPWTAQECDNAVIIRSKDICPRKRMNESDPTICNPEPLYKTNIIKANNKD